ncbi:putative bifunctional diguanylate cyclase/phosphodiesterase [Mycobacterium sp.]|uniref:putative bifunctional diguanylate cyclase/phosphodiesterase n=1 Tax=Mycobacterium sp. TaxID=1785 RepID=UPI002C12BB9F|nr:EAL domain-containing protein [Mycobacterium sp.]HTQ22724.1 EAL domain-containing protein [Mycobacterium sp.]
MPRSLDLVVTSVAKQLMEATASTATQVTENVLAQLVEQMGLSGSFLRHHDHDIRASVLVAEWPPRVDVPDPDPLAVVHFTSADPVLAECEHGRKPVVIRPDGSWSASSSFPRRAAGAKPEVPPSVAAAPLVSHDVTTGVLGFVKAGARKWKQEEINTLEAVAALFAQLQARIAAEEKLRYLAEHDDLTGLYNRRALVAHLSERLASGSPGPVAVLYLDLDRLKPINDYLGHTAGDWFIRVFAQRIRVCAGNQSMIARLGGDEFVVIPDQPMAAGTAESFARRLGTMLRERLAIGGHMITRTVSIGLAVGMPGRDNSTDLLRRADEAVLTAKRGGGNQVALSTDDMSLKSAFRNDIELHLQGDIDSEALLLHYLPEVDLWTGAIVAAEALVRWRHPIWGLLLPDSFIGVAESTNLAGELGRWVMRSACAEFSRWRANGVGQSAILRINVSPVQLITRGFVRTVADTIEEFGIDGGSVCLEITERAVVHDIETTRKTLSELKEVGVQIAIDDFGTGYAVLSHLKSLPVDMLKIDTGFVRDLGTNAGDLAIVRAIIGLAEAFGLQLVAEGVETPAAALTLMQHGCHRAQGFLLSRPVPGNAMEALLAARWMPMPFLADREALSLGAI